MSAKFTLELDCAPGYWRPGDLLPAVLEGTGVTLGEPVAKFFGNWAWDVPADQEAAYEVARDIIQARIEALYKKGSIRYGSW